MNINVIFKEQVQRNALLFFHTSFLKSTLIKVMYEGNIHSSKIKCYCLVLMKAVLFEFEGYFWLCLETLCNNIIINVVLWFYV